MANTTRRSKRNVIISSPPTSEPENNNQHDVLPQDVKNDAAKPLGPPWPATPSDSTPILSKNPAPSTRKPVAKTANHPSNAAPIRLPNAKIASDRSRSTSTSPQKVKARNGKVIATSVKSANLYTMFSNQAQRQGSGNGMRKLASSTSSVPVILKDEQVDLISDDEDDVDFTKSSASSLTAKVSKKRSSDVMSEGTELMTGSQKFMRRGIGSSVSGGGGNSTRYEEDTRPWAERFAPTSLDELGVHKKKVADVRAWLETVFAGDMRQRILVLKGAAGTGKTTTVQLLSKAIGCEVLEWRNPNGSVASADGFVSIASQFQEFINRGGKYGQLDLISEDVVIAPKVRETSSNHKSLILVEEFPDTFVRSSTALQSFRSAILQYLAINVPPISMMYANNKASISSDVVPLVMVVSETLLTTSTAAADSFTAHRLLGPEILQHPGVSVIEFNSMAPTLLGKALDLIVLKEARKSGRRKTPGPLVLKQLCEVGDVRSAIGSLEFLCLRGDDGGDWGAKIAFTKGKKSKTIPLTRMEEESLELVTRREASLGIFHAVGKVVYNKRNEQARNDNVEVLPGWLEERSRSRTSLVMVESLIDETGTDTSTFIAALHENYLLSCDANTSNIYDFSDIDHVNGCIDALSDSDLLCPSWDGSFNSTGFGGGTGGKGSGGDVLRQDEICFHVAVRGLLFSLPCPVKRRPPPGSTTMARGPSQFKMFYPTSLKLWRAQEEIGTMVDMYVGKILKGDFDTTLRGIRVGSASKAFHNTSRELKDVQRGEEEGSIHPTSTCRLETLLDRLPYTNLILKARNNGHHTIQTREMDKVTVFNGVGDPSSDENVEGDEGGIVYTGDEAWSTDRPGDFPEKGATGGKRKSENHGVDYKRTQGESLEERFAGQRLVLSEDDIEDSD